MKTILKNMARLAGMTLLAVVLTTTLGCEKKPKEAPASDYVEKLHDLAKDYNKKCPRQLANGTTLESVKFKKKTMTFRMRVTDRSIMSIDLDNTRDSIIQSTSKKLRKYLIKGDCNLEYKFISTNDSSSIKIVPNELKRANDEDEDDDDDDDDDEDDDD